ncbi:MAG TPA: hypothetical protein VFE23_16575 [Usitatibacter sp.]|nr:hypothetical protein [Usitatibacter sp.]
MRLLPALVASLPLLSFASSTTPDYTDLWYNPAESGWGANVVQQGSTLFVTFFVYGPNGQPTWYVASGATQSGGSTSGTFTGTLYQTTGPYFGAGSFDPASVGVTQVGQMTFNASASSASAATLTYTVNGTQVSKNVQRQTFAGDNIAGTYLGASMGTWSSCGTPRNGYVESSATFTVTQDGQSVQIREDGSNYTCSYFAAYGASGRLGTLAGNGLCSDGVNFTFTASEVSVGRDALAMRLGLQQVGGCRFDGRMGGMRKGAL